MDSKEIAAEIISKAMLRDQPEDLVSRLYAVLQEVNRIVGDFMDKEREAQRKRKEYNGDR